MAEAQKKRDKAKYDIDYAKRNIKRVPLDMQISDYEKLENAAKQAGEKVNAYIKKAIRQRMEREQVQGGGIRLMGEPSNTEQ